MPQSVYHAVGFLPYTRELVSFGVAPTREGAEALMAPAAEQYSKDREFPVRCAVLEFQIHTTVFRNSDDQIVDVVLTKAPVDKLKPEPTWLASRQYTDIAPFGSHPGRFA